MSDAPSPATSTQSRPIRCGVREPRGRYRLHSLAPRPPATRSRGLFRYNQPNPTPISYGRGSTRMEFAT
jgi:hypothetical protein